MAKKPTQSPDRNVNEFTFLPQFFFFHLSLVVIVINNAYIVRRFAVTCPKIELRIKCMEVQAVPILLSESCLAQFDRKSFRVRYAEIAL